MARRPCVCGASFQQQGEFYTISVQVVSAHVLCRGVVRVEEVVAASGGARC